MKLTTDEHAELVARLRSLQRLANELAEAFDLPESREGALQMRESIDRMLEILEGRASRD